MTTTSTKNKFDNRLYDITNSIFVLKCSEDQSTAFFIKTENIDIIKDQLSNPDEDIIKPFFSDIDDLSQHFIRPSFKKNIFEDDYIAFERRPIPGRLLDEKLKDEKLKKADFSPLDKLEILKKIAEVVKDAENANQFLCHGWLNPNNIFISDSNDVYITGWEEYVFTCNALHLPENSDSKPELNSYVKEFASPEVKKLQDNIDVSSEVYSLGIIIKHLFDNKCKNFQEYIRLANDCCHKDPNSRIRIDEFIEAIEELIRKITEAGVVQPRREARTNPWIWILVCGIISFVAGWYIKPSVPPETTPSPVTDAQKFEIISQWENRDPSLIASLHEWSPDQDNYKQIIAQLEKALESTRPKQGGDNDPPPYDPPTPPPSEPTLVFPSQEKHIELLGKVIDLRDADLFDSVWETLLETSPLEKKSKDQQKEIVKMLVFALKQEALKPDEVQNKDLLSKINDKLEPLVWGESVAPDIVGDVAKACIEDIIKKAKGDWNPDRQKIYLDCLKTLCVRFKGIPNNPQLEEFCTNYCMKHDCWLKQPIEFYLDSIKAKCTHKSGGFITSVKCNDRLINCSKKCITTNINIYNNKNNRFYSRPDEGIKLEITGKLNDSIRDAWKTQSQRSLEIYPFITSNFKHFSSTSRLNFGGKTEYIYLEFSYRINGKFVEDLYNEAFQISEETSSEEIELPEATESPEQPDKENESEDVSQ